MHDFVTVSLCEAFIYGSCMARVRTSATPQEVVETCDKSTFRAGIYCMPVSFRTIVQPNILLQACTKLGLTRDGRMPDLGPDKGTKKKASEYLAEGSKPRVHRVIHNL